MDIFLHEVINSLLSGSCSVRMFNSQTFGRCLSSLLLLSDSLDLFLCDTLSVINLHLLQPLLFCTPAPPLSLFAWPDANLRLYPTR